MFCRKCGLELEETAKFCYKCGTSTNAEETDYVQKEETKIVDKHIIKYTLKPTFNYGYKMVCNIMSVLFFIIVVSMVFVEDVELKVIGQFLTRVVTSLPFILIVIAYLLIKLIM